MSGDGNEGAAAAVGVSAGDASGPLLSPEPAYPLSSERIEKRSADIVGRWRARDELTDVARESCDACVVELVLACCGSSAVGGRRGDGSPFSVCIEEAGEPELLRLRVPDEGGPAEATASVPTGAGAGALGPSCAVAAVTDGVAPASAEPVVDGKGIVAAVAAAVLGGSSAATGAGKLLEVVSGTSSTDSMMTSSPGAVSFVVLMLTPPRLGFGLGGPRSGAVVGTSSRVSVAVPSTFVGSDGSRETPRRRIANAPPSYSIWTVAR